MFTEVMFLLMRSMFTCFGELCLEGLQSLPREELLTSSSCWRMHWPLWPGHYVEVMTQWCTQTKAYCFPCLRFRVKLDEISSYMIDRNNLLQCLPPNLSTAYHGLPRAVLHPVLVYPSKRLNIFLDPDEESPNKELWTRSSWCWRNSLLEICSWTSTTKRKLLKVLKSPAFKRQRPRFPAKNRTNNLKLLPGREVYLGVDAECS